MLSFKCTVQGLPSIHFRFEYQSLLSILLCFLLFVSAALLVYHYTTRGIASTTMSYALPLPSDQDIIAAVRQDKHDKKQQSTSYVENGFPLLQHGEPIAWVKSGGDELVDEAATQTYIHERFIQEPSLSDRLRVPKIYRVILCDDYPHTIVVMEYVHGRTVQQWLEISTERQDIFWGRILDAMKVLLALQPPGPITPPGPAGGGRIVHLVFGEYSQTESAPKDFDSVADLQNHVNQTIVSLEFLRLPFKNFN